jgi:hypothetical protein
MMSGVSLETCWAIKKHWNNNLYYTVASCWLFLYELYYDARFHEQVYVVDISQTGYVSLEYKVQIDISVNAMLKWGGWL